MLELAVLALLSESPMHGYELRKRLAAVLGAFHRFSYGSLYPCLRRLADAGYVTADDVSATTRLGGRSRVVYTLTGEGKEKLAELLGEGGPSSWEDEMFGVRFAFFAKTDAAVRLRILEGPPRPARGAPGEGTFGPDPDRRAVRHLHPRAAASWARVGGTRGPVAQRADRDGAGQRPDRLHGTTVVHSVHRVVHSSIHRIGAIHRTGAGHAPPSRSWRRDGAPAGPAGSSGPAGPAGRTRHLSRRHARRQRRRRAHPEQARPGRGRPGPRR
ncbi:PadR family transcriptional regulator [Frankia sp. ArI3]|uniref:PadR family transcriptional regulator n=1 Tax=Frankia sp. ArI3 TaxID=1858 RepID=UPI00351D7DBC